MVIGISIVIVGIYAVGYFFGWHDVWPVPESEVPLCDNDWPCLLVSKKIFLETPVGIKASNLTPNASYAIYLNWAPLINFTARSASHFFIQSFGITDTIDGDYLEIYLVQWLPTRIWDHKRIEVDEVDSLSALW